MSEFKREERYIVVKLKHLAGLQVAPLRNFLRENHVPTLDCVVVESDWPEYDKVWQSIERRMTGQPPVTAAEELEAVLHWRDKHAIAVKERDALQQRLTKTDERNDELSGMLQHLVNNPYRFTEAYREQIAAALKREPAAPSTPQPITEQFLEDHLGKMPERIKGMIAARGGEYAIMIDENNGHYGWTFRRDPNGTWVSGRKATDAEMEAARQYARHTNQQ